MSGILGKILTMLKKAGFTGMQYFYIGFQWCMKMLKIQLHKLSKGRAQKNMVKAYSGLGAEVYSLFKQGDQMEWKDMPAIQQALREIEEAESKVFAVDETIEEIQNNFLSKKEEIKEKYSTKRAQLNGTRSEEMD